MSEPLDPYEALSAALVEDDIRCKSQTPQQLTVSRQVGPIWPNAGNSFWVTHATDSWHLFTWSPIGYRVLDEIDMAELCRACMSHGSEAMHSVPDGIAEQFNLERLSEEEENIVYRAMGLG